MVKDRGGKEDGRTVFGEEVPTRVRHRTPSEGELSTVNTLFPTTGVEGKSGE